MLSRRTTLPLVLTMLLFSACGGDERSNHPPTAPMPQFEGLRSPNARTPSVQALPRAVGVQVRNNFFRSVRNGSGGPSRQAVDTVVVGGTVTWRWFGGPHNVTPVFHSQFRASPTRGAGFTYGPVRLNTRGRFLYRCTIHSRLVGRRPVGMAGVIVVR
ncbi:MAG: hypothetical protein M3336_11535 [Chloroflexota bacterium]|nr:hypothetical protein [Chloroflexota bacterium]